MSSFSTHSMIYFVLVCVGSPKHSIHLLLLRPLWKILEATVCPDSQPSCCNVAALTISPPCFQCKKWWLNQKANLHLSILMAAVEIRCFRFRFVKLLFVVGGKGASRLSRLAGRRNKTAESKMNACDRNNTIANIRRTSRRCTSNHLHCPCVCLYVHAHVCTEKESACLLKVCVNALTLQPVRPYLQAQQCVCDLQRCRVRSGVGWGREGVG